MSRSLLTMLLLVVMLCCIGITYAQPIPIIHPNPGGGGGTGSAVVTDNLTLQGNGASAANPLKVTSNGLNVGIGGTKANTVGVDGIVNVKNYGADPTGVADSTAAINTAVQAAFTGCIRSGSTPAAASVYLPAGIYKVTSPILLNNTNTTCTTRLFGAGPAASFIQAGAQIFPAIFIEPGNLVSTIGTTLGAGLTSSGGNSLQWTSSQAYWYSLKDAQTGANQTAAFGNAQPINGLAAFSLELFFNIPSSAASATYYMVGSFGHEQPSVVAANAMDFYITGATPTRTLHACLTLSTSGHICAAGTFTDNATYEAEMSYDGSNLRLFIGTPGSTTTLLQTTAGTGTIVQPVAQSFLLGASPNVGNDVFNWDTQSGTKHFIGNLDSIRLSNTARHTATYTAPNVKFAGDGSTAILINATSTTDDFLYVDTVLGTGAHPLIPAYSSTLLNANSHYQIDNLTFSGGSYGLLAIGSLFGYLDHFKAFGQTAAVRMWYDNYGWSVRDGELSASSFGEAPLQFMNVSGVHSVDHLHLTGGYYGLIDASTGGVISNVIDDFGSLQLSGWYLIGDSQFATFTFLGDSIDNENGSSGIPVEVAGAGSYNFINNFISASGSAAYTTLIDGNANNVTFSGSQLWGPGGMSEYVHFGSTGILNPLHIEDTILNGAAPGTTTIPISDSVSHTIVSPLACTWSVTIYGGVAPQTTNAQCMANFSHVAFNSGAQGGTATAVVTPGLPGATPQANVNCAQTVPNSTTVACVAPAGQATVVIYGFGW